MDKSGTFLDTPEELEEQGQRDRKEPDRVDQPLTGAPWHP